jgi:outer membrane protein OmpA-like peptidoglycan-associated protein
MFKFLQILLLVFCFSINAQEKKIETVYFEFDKYSLDPKQEKIIWDFVIHSDTTRIESIQIYGYCDDRGDNDYNYKLSENRVNTVQKILMENGFNKNKIVIIEGKGRVLLSDNPLENLAEIRSKNRRVDILIVSKNSFGKGIYNSFQDKHEIGDRIFLENILFNLGSSQLTESSKRELDKIVKILEKNKTIEFDIIGHVCCTPNYYRDAIDRANNERKLSVNRAKSVFRYLINKQINSLRMTYKGVGNRFPLGKGEEYDRRVEFLITKK